MVRPVAMSIDEFRLLRTVPTRLMDVDIYGHVNNVEYLSFFDTAVNGWYIDQGVLDMVRSEKIFLIVETCCQYLSEIRFPGDVTVGIKTVKLGASSVNYRIALFTDGSRQACAQGDYVHVLVDRKTRRPVPIDGVMRDLLTSILD